MDAVLVQRLLDTFGNAHSAALYQLQKRWGLFMLSWKCSESLVALPVFSSVMQLTKFLKSVQVV
ncbi:hypothetical protein HDN1F_37280 [gamma proteobacterium HdN1]|nr:hypothetical protein HDN1F_37280 [gamma proteobacterium HdN1]